MTDFVTLNDGRKLAYEQQGDLEGQPVFFFHGNPGSRLMRHPDNSIAKKLNAQIITVDRPGYGQSDFQNGRTLLDWADDIAHLADHLQLDKFHVMGVSAGGPYAIAVPYKLADRVIATACISSSSPLDRPDPYEGMNETYQQAFKSASLPEWLLVFIMGFRRRAILKDVDKSLNDSYAYLSENDRKILDTPATRDNIREDRLEAYRQGVKGMAREAKILVSPWGFDLSQVKPPVHLWYWGGDSVVPMQMGRYLEQFIPQTIPHFIDGGGHLSIYDYWEEIIDSLLKTNKDAS